MADTKSYKYSVAMTCGGCSGAVTRVLNRLKESGDVESFEVDLPGKTATVVTKPDFEPTVFEKIGKTGKKTDRLFDEKTGEPLASADEKTDEPLASADEAAEVAKQE